MWQTWGIAVFEDGRAVGVQGHYRVKLLARRRARAARRRLSGQIQKDAIVIVKRSSRAGTDWGRDPFRMPPPSAKDDVEPLLDGGRVDDEKDIDLTAPEHRDRSRSPATRRQAPPTAARR